MTIILTLETPDSDFISIECFSEQAANDIEMLLETRSNCKVRRPIQFREREEIDAAVRAFHIGRGCCDGTFLEPCPFKAKQNETREKINKREAERADYEAFHNADLQS